MLLRAHEEARQSLAVVSFDSVEARTRATGAVNCLLRSGRADTIMCPDSILSRLPCVALQPIVRAAWIHWSRRLHAHIIGGDRHNNNQRKRNADPVRALLYVRCGRRGRSGSWTLEVGFAEQCSAPIQDDNQHGAHHGTHDSVRVQGGVVRQLDRRGQAEKWCRHGDVCGPPAESRGKVY